MMTIVPACALVKSVHRLGPLAAGHGLDGSKERMVTYKETLRSLALSDESFVDSVLGMGRDTVEVSQLDPKTHALVRLGAALAIDAAPSSYQSTIETALAAGASVDEIVGSLIAIAPTIGLARVVSAAPELALALGYDLDVAFEETDGDK